MERLKKQAILFHEHLERGFFSIEAVTIFCSFMDAGASLMAWTVRRQQ